MRELKAIQTEYKGYRFRSRLEARWAVLLDELGVKWEYEPEGYDLGNTNGGFYCCGNEKICRETERNY